MKRKELFTMLGAIESLKDVNVSPKFGYGMAKNKSKIVAEVDILRALAEPSEGMKEYDKIRMELCTKYCEKHEDGKPKINTMFENGQQIQKFDMSTENELLLEGELEEVKKNFKDVLELNIKKENEFKDMLEEEVDINLFKMPLEMFPSQLKQSTMDALMTLVEEDKE